MSALQKAAVWGARMLPTGVKRWIHQNRFADDLGRKLFGKAMGTAPIQISSGPLAGVKLAPGEHVSHAHVAGTYELDVQAAIARMVRPGDVCFDLGASIGYLTLLMVKSGAQRVYAFEPAPHAQEEIRRHLHANQWSQVEIVPLPVSDQPKNVRFSLTHVAYGSAIAYGDSPWKTIELTATTLDAFGQEKGWPDFIKMDVEGEEDNVLAGARDLLAAQRTAFCIEVHSDEDERNCERLLEQHGYRLFQLNGQPWRTRTGVVAGEVQMVAYPPGRPHYMEK
ncbi:MAG: FkbM family methyltransferase [Bryobacteraceae bacterium]|nr:FkbM family methyltransferase [Bryobacteraceae bacterium]